MLRDHDDAECLLAAEGDVHGARDAEQGDFGGRVPFENQTAEVDRHDEGARRPEHQGGPDDFDVCKARSEGGSRLGVRGRKDKDGNR